jgi:hypothetical protein
MQLNLIMLLLPSHRVFVFLFSFSPGELCLDICIHTFFIESNISKS